MLAQKPKILMLGWEFPPFVNGGLGIACHNLAKSLAPFCDLKIIVPKAEENTKKENFSLLALNQLPEVELAEDGIETQIIDVYLYPYSEVEQTDLADEELEIELETEEGSKSPFAKGDVYGSDLFQKVRFYTQKATQAALEMEFDVIHAHDWMTFPAAMAISSRTQKPLVVHVHSTTYDRVGPTCKDWVYDIEKAAMQSANFVLPVSHYAAKILRDYYNVSIHKIIPIHNAASIHLEGKGKKAFSEKLVSFVGRIVHQKNPEAFLQIALKVWEKYDNVRFVMAGEGSLMPTMLQEVVKNKVSDKFHFSGFLERKEVEKLLSITDIFVMPSVSDPFGISALEAAHFGIPCIISRTSGVIEVLKNALTAEASDVDLMADYILMLLNDNELAAEIGEKCKKNESAATWDKAAQKVLGIYSLLLQKQEKEEDAEFTW